MRMSMPEILSTRRFWIASGTTVALIAGSVWAMTHEGVVPESRESESKDAPADIPVLASNTDGSISRDIDGQSWQCLSMNNPAYAGTFNQDKPTVVVPLDAMRIMGDITPPFLIIRGSDGPMKVSQTFSSEFRMMANGAETCVDGK